MGATQVRLQFSDHSLTKRTDSAWPSAKDRLSEPGMEALSVNAVGTLPVRCRPMVIRPIEVEMLPVNMFLAGPPVVTARNPPRCHHRGRE